MSLFSARSSLSSCSLAPSQGRFATFRHWISCTFRHSFNKNAILILLAIHGHRQAIRAVALAGLVVRAQTMVCARTTYAQSNHENDNLQHRSQSCAKTTSTHTKMGRLTLNTSLPKASYYVGLRALLHSDYVAHSHDRHAHCWGTM